MQTKLFVVGPSWVGDMVMAQGLFKFYKQNNPEATIDVLAPAWSLPLLARMPEVSSAIAMPLGHGQLQWQERYKLGKSLRCMDYSQAIVLPNSFKSALIPWFAKIPKRTGWRGEMRYGLLNDLRVLDPQRYPRMIDRFIALALPADASMPAQVPIPLLTISHDAQMRALSRHGLTLPRGQVLALCPGAEFGPAKRWPEQHFAAIARQKCEEGWQVWLFGSEKDKPVTQAIQAMTEGRCVDLAGRTTLEEAIDLIALATSVVSNDSGLMHVASALGKPLVAIYGPTSPAFTPPLHNDATFVSLSLACQPCFQRVCPLEHQKCMKDLSAERVLDVLRSHED